MTKNVRPDYSTKTISTQSPKFKTVLPNQKSTATTCAGGMLQVLRTARTDVMGKLQLLDTQVVLVM